MPGTDVQESSVTKDGYKVSYVGTYTTTKLTEAANSNAWVVKSNNLYNVNSDVNVGAYKGYFTVSTSSPVKALTFGFDF